MSRKRSAYKRALRTARSDGAGPDTQQRKAPKDTAAELAKSYIPSPGAIRETIESVVIAFVLAFLFRTFEAEAFVIPTGSMAPTLMGRHKDLECLKCGFAFQVSASEEVDQETNAYSGNWTEECVCPMCRYSWTLGSGRSVLADHPSFKGDRILVGKFCYQFGDPKRWDVAVFKYPGGAQTNFIKRLVGLPGEVLEIRHGDVFTCPLPENADELSVQELKDLPKTIAQKPPDKLLAMLQPVFDNDVTPKLAACGFAPRWRPRPLPQGDSAGTWRTLQDGCSYETDGAGSAWLRYEHRVPSRTQWADLQSGATPEVDPDPQPIRDFCAYNTGRGLRDRGTHPSTHGLYWVGDLALMCTLDVLGDSGQIVFELIEGARPMQCRIDVATGKATMTIGGVDIEGNPAQALHGGPYQPTASTVVRGRGRYEIIFCNVDDQLRLWVDGSPVEFDAQTSYSPLANTRPEEFLFDLELRHRYELDGEILSRAVRLQFANRDIILSPQASVSAAVTRGHWRITDGHQRYTVRRRRNTLYVFDAAADLAPVGIASQGAAVRLSHLVIKRDVYYTPDGNRSGRLHGGIMTDRQDHYGGSSRWRRFDPPFSGNTAEMNSLVFKLKPDQFLALGDNSAKSKDGRLWGQEYYVDRRLLIGKALSIYWPHSWDKLPGTDIPLPMFPNFPRMSLVR